MTYLVAGKRIIEAKRLRLCLDNGEIFFDVPANSKAVVEGFMAKEPAHLIDGDVKYTGYLMELCAFQNGRREVTLRLTQPPA